MFRVSGIWRDRPVEVIWQEGAISASIPLLAELLEEKALAAPLLPVSFAGPYLEGSLVDPAAALLLIRQQLDEIVSEEGELPSLAALLAQ